MNKTADRAAWRRVLVYYRSVLISSLIAAAPFWLALWYAVPKDARHLLVGSLVTIGALVLGVAGNISNIVEVRRHMWSRSLEEQELKDFQRRTDETVRDSIIAILQRRAEVLEKEVAAIFVENKIESSPGTYPIYVFAQDFDDKFRALEATI